MSQIESNVGKTVILFRVLDRDGMVLADLLPERAAKVSCETWERHEPELGVRAVPVRWQEVTR
jgi:hypothetical protein